MKITYNSYVLEDIDHDSYSYSETRDSFSFAIEVVFSEDLIAALITKTDAATAALRQDNKALLIQIRTTNTFKSLDPASRTAFAVRAEFTKTKDLGAATQKWRLSVNGLLPAPEATGDYPIAHSFTVDESRLIVANFNGKYHSSGGTSALTLINNATNGALKKCADFLTTYYPTYKFDYLTSEFNDEESTDNAVSFTASYRERPFENEKIGAETDDYNISSFDISKDISMPTALSGVQPIRYTLSASIDVNARNKNYDDFVALYLNTIRPFLLQMLDELDLGGAAVTGGTKRKIKEIPRYDIRGNKISVSWEILQSGKNNYIQYSKNIAFMHSDNRQFIPLGDGKKYSDYITPKTETLQMTLFVAFTKIGSESDFNLKSAAKTIKPPTWLKAGNGSWIYLTSSPKYEASYEATNAGEISTHSFTGSANFRWQAKKGAYISR